MSSRAVRVCVTCLAVELFLGCAPKLRRAAPSIAAPPPPLASASLDPPLAPTSDALATPTPSSSSSSPSTTAKPQEESLGRRCDVALQAAFSASKVAVTRTSMAETKHLLAVFGSACHDQFPSWAEAALLASRGGRKERSRILAHAVVEVCGAAVGKELARDVIPLCPPTPFQGAASRLWDMLDAGTYAFVLALRAKGVESSFVDELMLQASFNAELDR